MQKTHFLLLLFYIPIITFGNTKTYNFGHIDYTHGLSNNQILCFAEDNNGFLWIGTRSGLNRYDGYEIKSFIYNDSDSIGIPDNIVSNIVCDQLGRFWLFQSQGYTLFNPNKELFTSDFEITCNGQPYFLHNIAEVLPYKDSTIFFRIYGKGILKHNIYTNKNYLLEINSSDSSTQSQLEFSRMQAYGNKLYTIYKNGLIEEIDIKTFKITDRNTWIKENFKIEPQNYDLKITSDSVLWIFSHDLPMGIIKIYPNGKTQTLNTSSSPALNSNIISSIIEDSNKDVWIGTDHGGLNIVNKKNNTIRYVLNEALNENSLSQNVVTSLFVSSDSTIWIGSFKHGINYYNKNLYRFKHFINHPIDKNSLPYNDVNCFVEDKKGNIWIGTNGQGLIYYDRINEHFNKIDTKNKLRSDVIVSLFIDKQEDLWIGTYHGGLSKFDGKTFTTYKQNPKDHTSINADKVWDIFEDSHSNLWIGLLSGGLDLFDRKANIFHHYSGVGVNMVDAEFIMDITEDKKGNIWFGTDNGVYYYDYLSSRFIHLEYNEDDLKSISAQLVFKVFCDSRNNIWAGTPKGLDLYEAKTNTFLHFNTKNGLSDNSIMSILESDHGDLWLGTTNGITKLVVDYNKDGSYKSHYTVSYNESDGLQGREFNEGSALKTSKGELIFGGANGFNLILPQNTEKENKPIKAHIVSFDVFGKTININSKEEDAPVIKSAILDNETLKLPYSSRMFSLNFLAIDFISGKKINYRYKLEGFDDQWIYTDWKDRKATFTNLSPGKYRFVVQSSDFLSDWNKSESSVSLIIAPPWYRTIFAYICYFTLFALVILLLRSFFLTRAKSRFQREEALKESERQHELNLLKTRFFTNVSHEFRTPLTLILTPLERILKNDIDEKARKHLELVYLNANRLLQLVNQLLDFRKAEENKLKLNPIYGNIINLINQTLDSFQDLKDSKNIELKHLPYNSQLYMQFDKDKIEKILLNLLSNAFKFTPNNGHINVISKLIKREETEYFQMRVEDDGIGMNPETQEKIFDRFFQTNLPNRFITRGSGIGLSLAKDFVELHNGRIYVRSEINQGSVFYVEIPVNREPINNSSVPESQEDIKKHSETESVNTLKNEFVGSKRTIMIVEDNNDFRFYLKDSFKDKYNILEAENGKQALSLVEKNNVNLIVSDVMMPEMDGLELCNRIKTDPNYSHIPIILLTAKSTQQDKLDGLKQGADEYISKPFSFEILESRIYYLIKLRKKFINQFQENFELSNTKESKISPLDEKLLKKVHTIIKENLSNPELTVESLSRELGMSRVNLYKKMTALTGKTPVEFIRLVRLKRSTELLMENSYTVSEIAYEVGFSDPRYFSKQFKAEYKILPSKYRESRE